MQRPQRHGWGLLVLFMALAAMSLCWNFLSTDESKLREVRLDAAGNGASRTASRAKEVFAPLHLLPSDVPWEAPREGGVARMHAVTLSHGAPDPAAEEAASRGEKLTGRVLRPDGTPVAGARVVLGNRIAETEPDGRYTLPLVAGSVKEEHLTASHPAYFSRQVPLATARSGEIPIVLIPGGRVEGTVRKPGGGPLTGARVRFGTGELPPAVSTDAMGTFESPILPLQPLIALVVHPDYQPSSSRVMPGASEKKARLDVTLVGGEKLHVDVRSHAGALLPDAKIWIRRAGEAVGTWNFLGTTGDLGTLDTRRPEGRASLRVDLPGFVQATRPLEALEKDGEIPFSLRPAKALSGDAVDRKSGLPVDVTDVRLEVFNVLTKKFVEVADRGSLYKSRERGKFIVGLPTPAGTYRVAITARGRDDASRVLRGSSEPVACESGYSETENSRTTEAGDGATPTSLVVRLEERLELYGVASGPEGPVAALEIELLAAPWNTPTEEEPDYGAASQRDRLHPALLNPERLPVVETTTTGEDGRFWFQGLHPRVYRLRARLEGFAEYLSAPFEVPWEGHYPVTLRRSATLSGTVVGPDDLPKPDFPIAIVRGDETVRRTRTDRQGTFVFPGLGPGEGYRVLVGDSHGEEQETKTGRWLTIEEGKDVVYDVRLPPASTQTPGAPAALADDTEANDTPPGETVTSEAPPEGPPPDSSPPELLSYTLELLEASKGVPVEGHAEVELQDLEGESKWIGSATEASFAATGLRPGRYRLRVRIEKLLLHEADFDLQESRKDSVRLQRATEVSVRLLVSENKPFRGRAEVRLLQGERELYKQVQMIDETVTIPTPGAGEYELVVQSADRSARMRIAVGSGAGE